MNRAAVFAFALAAATGCGPKSFDSLCDNTPTEPEACKMACDPLPGASNTCPSGFHCTPDGKCDAFCTQGGNECGDGYVCTTDGQCMQSDTGSNEPFPDADCPAVMFTATAKTPSIGLVLDRSGSMTDNNLGTVTRYQAMRDALVGTNGVVVQLQDKAYFGSELYTGGTPGAQCPDLNSVPRALNNAAAIRASIDANADRGGNTPTPQAVDAMVATFAANPPPPDSPPVIVLATDGLPNTCDDGSADTRPQSVAAVAAAYAAGIPVYVLAINQSAQHFQDLANAGQGWQPGQPNVNYFVANNATQLSDAFQQIINGVVSCELSIDSPIDQNQAASGVVTLNGTMLTYGTDWTLSSPTTITLVGQACTDLKSSANPVVNATFPCGSIIGRVITH